MTVEKFALELDKINMPVPSGTYRLDFTFYAYGIARTLTQVFFEKIDWDPRASFLRSYFLRKLTKKK